MTNEVAMFNSRVKSLETKCGMGEVDIPFREMAALALEVEKELHATQTRAKYLEDALRQHRQYF